MTSSYTQSSSISAWLPSPCQWPGTGALYSNLTQVNSLMLEILLNGDIHKNRGGTKYCKSRPELRGGPFLTKIIKVRQLGFEIDERRFSSLLPLYKVSNRRLGGIGQVVAFVRSLSPGLSLSLSQSQSLSFSQSLSLFIKIPGTWVVQIRNSVP